MIFGIGVDMTNISRFEAILKRKGNAFIQKIMSDREWSYWQTTEYVNLDEKKTARKVCKYWLAKEAVSKAMGTGFDHQLSWREINLIYSEKGAPKLSFDGKAKQFMDNKLINQAHISFSDEKDTAIAMVVLSCESHE